MFLELSHQKCWFSEAKDRFSHLDVEHYRPKMRAKNKGGKPRLALMPRALDRLTGERRATILAAAEDFLATHTTAA